MKNFFSLKKLQPYWEAKKRLWVGKPWHFPVFCAASAGLSAALLVGFSGAISVSWKEGEVAAHKIKSPVTFDVEDTAATRALREEARLKVPLVFEQVAVSPAEAQQKLSDYFFRIRRIMEDTETRVESRLARLKEITGVSWTREQLQQAKDLPWEALEEESLSQVRRMWKKGWVLETPPGASGTDLPNREMVIRDKAGNILFRGHREEAPGKLWTKTQAVQELLQYLEKRFRAAFLRDALRRGLEEVFSPTARFLQEPTLRAEEEAAKKAPPVLIHVRKNERIIADGEVITREHVLKLEKLSQIRGGPSGWPLAGFLMGVFILGACFLYRTERAVFSKRRHWVLFFTLILGVLMVSKGLSALSAAWPQARWAFPATCAPLLSTLLLSPTTGVLSAFLCGFAVAPLSNFNVGLVLMSLAGGLAAVLMGEGIRTRNDFLRAGAMIGAVQAAVIFFSHFLGFGVEEPMQALVSAAGGGLLLCSALAWFSLAWVENAFRVVSDVRLLELSDLNHPLLQKMQLEAPGTYHHSLVVASLAQAAAEKIGANPLLVRVGAYFHDLGKIARSHYFVENQEQRESTHEGLSPYLSAMIIQNHVKEGLALAKAFKLPEPVRDFIPQHQGTTLIRTFYQKAKEQSGGEAVDEQKFRYLGPKPQTKETALVMLADSVESAARSLKNLTPDQFEEVVERVFRQKIEDHQLEECSLTLKDLKLAARSFVRTLCAVHHLRPAYPDEKTRKVTPLFREGETSHAQTK